MSHHAPLCRCGSRYTKRIGESALQRQCQHCGRTFTYRVVDGRLLPFSQEVALLMDRERR